MRPVAFRPFSPLRHRGGLLPRARGLVILTLLAGLSPLAVRAQDTDQMTSREGIALQNQVMDLRQQLSQMQAMQGQNANILPPPAPEGSRGNGGGPVAGGGDLTAQLLDRVMTLEQQVRDMRGQLDQLTNQVQQQNASLAKQIDDMNFAMQNGGHAAPRPAAAPDVPPAAAGGPDEDDEAPPPVKRTPEVLLRDGNAALMHGDYAAAQMAAKQVLAGPHSPLQIDAQFLLAQSLAGQKQYRQSAVAYYDTYNRAPRSGRAPDALLGVTASLLAMGDKNSACQALAKLKSEFPSPAPRVKTAETAYRTRAGCH